MAEWLSGSNNSSSSGSASSSTVRKTYQMSDGSLRKRKRIEGTGLTPSGILSTFTTTPKLKTSQDVPAQVVPPAPHAQATTSISALHTQATTSSSALQIISTSYGDSNNQSDSDELFPFYNKDEKKPETRISRPIFPSPRESIHRHVPPKEPPVHEVRVTSTADVIMKGVPNKPQSIPFLKTPENQDPVIKSMRKFRDERMEVTSSSSPLVAASSSSSSSSSSSQPPPTHLTVETATSSSSFNNSAGNGSGMTGGSGSGSGMTGVSMTGSGSGIGMTGGGGSSSGVTGGSINVETLSLEVEARSGLNVEIRKPTNPINKPIDGAPTRRPKVPKEEPVRSTRASIGSTADNPMTLDSSDDEAENNAGDVHQWCISAAHIGSLTKLDVTILEINMEHFEFNVTSEVLLAEVKVCVPWNEVVKIETHFSSDLLAIVIHVEELWANGLIGQLKNALSRQFPLELDPMSAVRYKRVISLEFVKEPPASHLNMMGYYLNKHHTIKMNRIESVTSNYIKDLLPPVDHFDSHMDTDVIEQDTRTLLVYPPPPAQASITLTYADLECLKPEEFLNDSILDFYLKYIHHELMSPALRDKTHLFNSFFYKALTQPAKKEPKKDPTAKKLNPSERMHQQVKKWSKSIDLFSKDYIIVPINEHSHWYLAIICYPWLEAPHFEDNPNWKPSNKRSERDGEMEADEKDIDGVLSKAREHSTMPPITCRPCVLMFDSLVANGRNRVVSNIRNYLAVEWKTKSERGPRSFTKNNFPGIFVEGPLQENFCDCGVFLLQFVEKFFESPITDYRFPVERKDWFSQQDITKKRESIRKLIVRLGPNKQFAIADR